jgi:hypothetical protein
LRHNEPQPDSNENCSPPVLFIADIGYSAFAFTGGPVKTTAYLFVISPYLGDDLSGNTHFGIYCFAHHLRDKKV